VDHPNLPLSNTSSSPSLSFFLLFPFLLHSITHTHALFIPLSYFLLSSSHTHIEREREREREIETERESQRMKEILPRERE
jgi:uncharacterized membrane protein